MAKKKADNNPSDGRFNTDFWKEQRRKTLIESTGASVRLSGSKITNEEVAKITDSGRVSNKTLRLRFREVNRDIFDAIRDGRKKVETRAATVRYQKAKKGDHVILVCGKDIFEKHIADVHIFKSIDDILKKYKVQEINPNVETEEELRKLYYSFPGYREKIKKHGLVAIELM